MECLQYTGLNKVQANNVEVLNLVINGMPSIPTKKGFKFPIYRVLNLVINGMPSIHEFEYNNKKYTLVF